MKLNPDCVRDILIAIESATDSETVFRFSEELLCSQIPQYDYNTLLYHIRQCSKAGLIDGIRQYDGGETGIISDLSPTGHQLLSDIRSETVWNTVKDVSKKVGSNSIQAIGQISTGVITAIIKAQLGL